MTERTRMRSEMPGRPGWSEHAPRTIRSMSTPADDASYSASMTGMSTTALLLTTICAGRPAAACAFSRSTSSRKPGRSECGATSSRRNDRAQDRFQTLAQRTLVPEKFGGGALVRLDRGAALLARQAQRFGQLEGIAPA